MGPVLPNVTQIIGETQGLGSTALLDPVYIFKGKLRAAATRDKFHDSADLRWLESRDLTRLQQNKGHFNLLYVGLALNRYPELYSCFSQIGLDIQTATAMAASHNIRYPPPPQQGDVQKGLLASPLGI